MTLILRPVVSFCQCSNVCINKVHKKKKKKNIYIKLDQISRLEIIELVKIILNFLSLQTMQYNRKVALAIVEELLYYPKY